MFIKWASCAEAVSYIEFSKFHISDIVDSLDAVIFIFLIEAFLLILIMSYEITQVNCNNIIQWRTQGGG